ncbi:hypothetical protein ABMA59_28490 [Mesorhizobium sp. CN2-181]
MTDRRQWQRGSQYFEGTRVRYLGETYQAKMDMPVSIPPIGDPQSRQFWLLVSILPRSLRSNSATDNAQHMRSALRNHSYVKKVIR